MDVENVDIRSAQLLQRIPDGEVKRFGRISTEIDSDLIRLAELVTTVIGSELRRDNHLITITALLHPFADELLGGLVLAILK